MLEKFQKVSHENKSHLSLKEVIQAFREWRLGPQSGRIPESLWNQVFELLNHYPKSKVLNSLWISNRQLQKQLLQRTSCPNKNVAANETDEKPAFVKAMISAPAASTESSNCYDITITRLNGVTLNIQQLAHTETLKIIQHFIGK